MTKKFLLSRFQRVDMIEQSPRLLAAAPEYIGSEFHRVTCIQIGLQVYHHSLIIC